MFFREYIVENRDLSGGTLDPTWVLRMRVQYKRNKKIFLYKHERIKSTGEKSQEVQIRRLPKTGFFAGNQDNHQNFVPTLVSHKL